MKRKRKMSYKVNEKAWGQVVSQVWNQAYKQVGDRDQAWCQFEYQVWNQVANQVMHQVWEDAKNGG